MSTPQSFTVMLVSWVTQPRGRNELIADVEQLNTARRNIPVTTQRRFDVYPDVSA